MFSPLTSRRSKDKVFMELSVTVSLESITMWKQEYQDLFCGFSRDFNLLMFATHHKIWNITHSLIVTAPATLPSAYSVGIISGVFFTTHTFQRALTFLGGYRLFEGTAALAIMMLTVIWSERIGFERIQE